MLIPTTTLSPTLLFLVVVSLVNIGSNGWSNVEVSRTGRCWTFHSHIHQPVNSPRSVATALNKIDKQKDMIDFIEEPLRSQDLVGDKIFGPPEQDDLADLVRTVVRAADARKAENIVALRVSKVSTVTSFVVIATGNSRPQNQAIAASVKKDVQELYGLLPGSTGVPEGSPETGWIVLDFGSVMVHVMTPKSRLFYNVEGQWKEKGGEYMNLADVVIPNTVLMEDDSTAALKAGTMQGIPKEEDPFWS
jgi:ribosome-associated protein